MVYDNNSLKVSSPFIKSTLDLLSREWEISQEIYDLHLGERDDLEDSVVDVDGIKFHIPRLTRDGLFVLWRCLWPDCNNCCNRSNVIPLTKDDIKSLSKRMGYYSKVDFIKKETIISSWAQKEFSGKLENTRTHISLKRKRNENEKDEGKVIRCRFMNSRGCGIHASKPGVCSMYPFVSYLETDKTGRSIIHAQFQFTGDCPGFYLEKSLEHMTPTLKEYSQKIYRYTMEYLRTQRENYSVSSTINLVTPKTYLKFPCGDECRNGSISKLFVHRGS
jgi:uncharacterized protein